MAEAYRNAEVPFKVFAVPDIEAVTEKWTDDYLSRNMNRKPMVTKRLGRQAAESRHP